MKKTIFKIVTLLCIISIITCTMCSCSNNDVDGVWSEIVTYEPIDDGTSEEINNETSPSNSTDDKTSIIKNGKIEINKKNSSKIKIVASLSNEGYDQARLVQKVIRATTGASIQLISDYENSDGIEIIIGDTARNESQEIMKTISGTQYIIKINNDGKIIIAGTCLVALENAVYTFLNQYFGYTYNQKEAGIATPIDIGKTIKADVLEEYKSNLVWGDEFDGKQIDTSKWDINPQMSSNASLELRNDDTAYSISDGCIKLTSGRVNNEHYYTPESLTTQSTMGFVYGYAEMRAKVPFGKPAWPSWWLLPSTLGERKTYNYDVEIDIFEVFATPDTMEPNLHKWYRDGSGDHDRLPTSKKTPLVFENEIEAEKWHTYGFLWTSTSINLLVDGEVWQYLDITDNGDFGTRGDGMSGFHDPLFMIFNNYIYTKDYSGAETWAAGLSATPDDKFPIDYYIDYVRLYQKKGEGQLYLG